MIPKCMTVLGLASALLAACASNRPGGSVGIDGRYCFAAGDHLLRTCTPVSVPSGQTDAEAKRFESTPGMLTLYIVRKRWADTANMVDIRVDEAAPITTVPDSLVKIRLAPGGHHLALACGPTQAALEVVGTAGEVRFVELKGSMWLRGSRYSWTTDDQAGARSRALTSRLIAVVDLLP